MGKVLRDRFVFKAFYVLLALPTNLECSFQESENNEKCPSLLNLGAFIPLFRRSFLPWKCYLLSVPKRPERWFLCFRLTGTKAKWNSEEYANFEDRKIQV